MYTCAHFHCVHCVQRWPLQLPSRCTAVCLFLDDANVHSILVMIKLKPHKLATCCPLYKCIFDCSVMSHEATWGLPAPCQLIVPQPSSAIRLTRLAASTSATHIESQGSGLQGLRFMATNIVSFLSRHSCCIYHSILTATSAT